MTYRAPDEDEARAILDAMERPEENLGPGRGQLIYSIGTKDGTRPAASWCRSPSRPGGFTLADDQAEDRHEEVQYANVSGITILGYAP